MYLNQCAQLLEMYSTRFDNRAEAKLAIVSTPEFATTCIEANDDLNARKQDPKLVVINMQHAHCLWMHCNNYSYKELQDVIDLNSKGSAQTRRQFFS